MKSPLTSFQSVDTTFSLVILLSPIFPIIVIVSCLSSNWFTGEVVVINEVLGVVELLIDLVIFEPSS